MNNFKDKVVVIPGGATGIGFGFAKAFGMEGAKIVIAAPPCRFASPAFIDGCCSG